MNEKFEYELYKAASDLVDNILHVKEDETVCITADTKSYDRVVNATSAATFNAGAKPMIIRLASPQGSGKAADPMLPLDALTASLKETEVWIEFNEEWLLYSTPFEIAFEENDKLRYICLVGMSPDMMVRMIGRIDLATLSKLLHKITDLTKNAKQMRITTPAGTDLTFENHPERPVVCDAGEAASPGMYMLPGQISWAPKFESIKGTLVFDGSISPPLGLLNEPVTLQISKGKITGFQGGKEAREYKKWLKSFEHPRMLRLAHPAYGLNPGAKLTGNVVEDERVWGCVEWGIGYVSPDLAPERRGIEAPSHSDGICLDASVWLDDMQIMDEGEIIAPEELVQLKEKLNV